jgi:hypothetical protein
MVEAAGTGWGRGSRLFLPELEKKAAVGGRGEEGGHCVSW